MKTKLLLALILALFLKIECYSQNSNEFRAYYGFVDSELLRNTDLDGAGSFDNENSFEFGLGYLKKISDKFSIQTGINFMRAKVKITPAFTGVIVDSRYENLKMISIPIFANYTFWKYFFVNAGTMIDIQSSGKSFDSQSGIGYSIGIGGKYSFKKFLIYFNPNFKRHSFTPFEKKNYNQKLTEFGIQLGIGYSF